MLNIKKRMEEIIYQISNEIKTIQTVYESFILLDQEDIQEVLDAGKFQKFLKGVQTLHLMIRMYKEALVVAEA